jgi:hypothetical protein
METADIGERDLFHKKMGIYPRSKPDCCHGLHI